MEYVTIGGIRQPLNASAWNPRYRAGIRHCAELLASRDGAHATQTYVYQNEEFYIESDMWKLAEAILELSIPDRIAHGWPDIGRRQGPASQK